MTLRYDWEDVEDPAGIVRAGMVCHPSADDWAPFYCVSICAPAGMKRDKLMVCLRWPGERRSLLEMHGLGWHHTTISIKNVIPFTWRELVLKEWLQPRLDQFKRWIDEEEAARKKMEQVVEDGAGVERGGLNDI